MWQKLFGPAQNILGPVKGQGICEIQEGTTVTHGSVKSPFIDLLTMLTISSSTLVTICLQKCLHDHSKYIFTYLLTLKSKWVST